MQGGGPNHLCEGLAAAAHRFLSGINTPPGTVDLPWIATEKGEDDVLGERRGVTYISNTNSNAVRGL